MLLDIKNIDRLIAIALGKLGYKGEIDKEICKEIVIHWDRDIRKLKEIHGQKKGIAPEKIIGYLAFWIRKLQPISFASPFSLDENQEPIIAYEFSNNHINELVSIYIIKLLLISYYEYRSSKEEKQKKALSGMANRVDKSFDSLMSSLYSESPNRSFLQICLYDMRYRTFGPHHFTHAVRYVMDNAGINFSKSTPMSEEDFHSCKSVLHMRVFISAPGDIQESKIKSSELENLIKNKYKQWIETHGVVVTLLTMEDFRSARDNKKNTQNEILRQISDKFDVYLGMIDLKFGTPTTGVGSGTLAEYNYAIGASDGKPNLDGKFIMFGRNTDAEKKSYDKLKQEGAQLDKIDEFFKAIGDNGQLWYSWNDSNFDEKFIQQIEKTIVEFKESTSIL